MEIIKIESWDEWEAHMERSRQLARDGKALFTEDQKKIRPGSAYQRYIPEYDLEVYGYCFTVDEQISNELKYASDEPDLTEDYIRSYVMDQVIANEGIGMLYTLSFSAAAPPEFGSVYIGNMDREITKAELMEKAIELGYESELIRWLGEAYKPEDWNIES